MELSIPGGIRTAYLLVIAGLIGASSTFYISARAAETHTANRAYDDLQSSVNALRFEVKNSVEWVEATVAGAAGGPALTAALRGRDASGASEAIDSLVRQLPAVVGAATYDANGWLLARVPAQPGVVSEIGADAELAETTPRLVDNDATYAIKRPVVGPDGTVLGSLIAEVSLGRTVPGISRFRLGSTGRASLLDSAGRILLSGQPDMVATSVSRGNVGSMVDRWRFATVEAFNPVVGRDELVAFGPANPRLAVMVAQSRSEAFSPVIRFGWWLIVALFCLMASVSGAAVIARSMLRSLQAKSTATQTELDETSRILPGLASSMLRAHSNIMGIVQTLRARDGDLAAETREVLFTRVEANAALIERLSERLRFTGLIESSSLQLAAAPVELREVVQAALKNLAVDLDRHRVQVVIPDDLVAIADERALRRVIEELVSNASRSSGPGSLIIVRARRSASEAIVSVDDEGIGVAPEVVPHLFERSAHGGSSDGQGLGLWIAMSVVKAMGGDLWWEPEIQRGSTFSLRIPVAAEGRNHLRVVGAHEGVRTA